MIAMVAIMLVLTVIYVCGPPGHIERANTRDRSVSGGRAYLTICGDITTLITPKV